MSVEKDEVLRLNPIARPILQGLYDSESPLHKLLGLHFILKSYMDKRSRSLEVKNKAR